MKKILLTMLLLASATASGNPLSASEYECSQINVEVSGFKCAVSNHIAGGYSLLIRMHPIKNASKEQTDKANYIREITKQNFLARGGKWIVIRSRFKDGIEMQRSCARFKGNGPLVCNDWEPAVD